MRTTVLDNQLKPVLKSRYDSLSMTALTPKEKGFILSKAESKTASWYKSVYEKCFSYAYEKENRLCDAIWRKTMDS